MNHSEINDKLRRIPGVLDVNVVFDENDELSEVHIMADCSRPGKEVMLDAKSVLFVCLKKPVDFRKISVARIDADSQDRAQMDHKDSAFTSESGRVMLVAAYVKRLSSDEFEVAVELKLDGRPLTGSSRGTVGQSMTHSIAAGAVVNALSELLPDTHIVPRVELLGSYCIADMIISEGSGSDGSNLIGAVRASGDIPWDVARAVLKALNRRLGQALVELAE